MQNARLRLGRLEYFKAPANSKSAPTHITLWMDRAIVRPAGEGKPGVWHLISVFGGEQETAAIAAAISEESRFTISSPELPPNMVANVPEASRPYLVIVRDGPLHLLPFDALSRLEGRFAICNVKPSVRTHKTESVPGFPHLF